MFLFILDSLGNGELLLILVAALIFFGPRKLPHLSRSIGKSLSEFRRASDDFKRTWAQEVALEGDDSFTQKPHVSPANASILAPTVQRNAVLNAAADESANPDSVSLNETDAAPSSVQDEDQSVARPLSKQDWL